MKPVAHKATLKSFHTPGLVLINTEKRAGTPGCCTLSVTSEDSSISAPLWPQPLCSTQVWGFWAPRGLWQSARFGNSCFKISLSSISQPVLHMIIIFKNKMWEPSPPVHLFNQNLWGAGPSQQNCVLTSSDWDACCEVTGVSLALLKP